MLHDLLGHLQMLLHRLLLLLDDRLQLGRGELFGAGQLGQHADVGADLLGHVALIELGAFFLAQLPLGEIEALLRDRLLHLEHLMLRIARIIRCIDATRLSGGRAIDSRPIRGRSVGTRAVLAIQRERNSLGGEFLELCRRLLMSFPHLLRKLLHLLILRSLLSKFCHGHFFSISQNQTGRDRTIETLVRLRTFGRGTQGRSFLSQLRCRVAFSQGSAKLLGVDHSGQA